MAKPIPIPIEYKFDKSYSEGSKGIEKLEERLKKLGAVLDSSKGDPCLDVKSESYSLENSNLCLDYKLSPRGGFYPSVRYKIEIKIEGRNPKLERLITDIFSWT